MGKKCCGDISFLAGHIPEPYQTERVMAAARELGEPFILRECVQQSGLNRHIVHRVLSRMVHKGVLTRRKILAPYPSIFPGESQRSTYLYSFPAIDE